MIMVALFVLTDMHLDVISLSMCLEMGRFVMVYQSDGLKLPNDLIGWLTGFQNASYF